MSFIAKILVGLVALIHIYIAWFEIFAWTTRGPKVFSSFPPELFAQTTSMAANQGLYNSFLAAGLIWSLFIKDPKWARNIAICFLLFVAVAGLFGALTVSTRTIYAQLVPALFAIAAILFTKPRGTGG
jgi:putative membrane protein